MTEKLNYVWYASYGSNLLENRFLCYIRGGSPVGTEKKYEGCTDKSLPLDSRKIEIKREFYFAKESKTWKNGGVGFIRNEFDKNSLTLGRMYLISQEQFIEVIKQETSYKGELNINFQKAIKKENLIFKAKSWYGNLIYLGKEDGYPIFTFTNEKDLIDEINQD